MAIDTSKTVYLAGTSTAVRLLATDLRGDFPILASIDEDGHDVVVRFDADGESEDGGYELTNKKPAVQVVRDGEVLLPAGARPVVQTRSRRRGGGVVEKVRNHDTRSYLVRPTNGGAPFWAINRKLVFTGAVA
ncbi:hypothetical protein [Methylobacterium indicum]|uniref:Uncharacterized protein n=1 Tax=Methylobacterium indicum TaxID=1775910 RepID=A0A8H8X0F0_9HYPH|nr:hypothetical protein [Methylobacterium indicum]BCM87818.1 hypothetical protein mvi_62790 [Methylobacterium indicum]